jgi:hypothetical protein
MKTHATGAKFFDFKTSPIFVGKYLGEEIKREEDDAKDDTKKKGDLMGFAFLDLVNDEETIIGSSFAISKAVKGSKKGTIFGIEFLAKETKGDRPFNRFKVDEAESDQDVKDLLKAVGVTEEETEHKI